MRKRRRIALLALAVTAISVAGATAALAGDNDSGFKTAKPALLSGKDGWTVEAVISVGDTLPGGYMFEAIPDGISIGNTNGKGTADILVNHELSLVPFPATRQDPSNSTVSRLRLNQHSAGVLKGDYVIPLSSGYQRFCSNFLVGPEHGFERTLLLTNEEARDTVLRQEDAWHQPNPSTNPFGVMPSDPGAEQAGVVVAYDVKSGASKSIFGMGRHNHENSVGIPGYGHPVVLSGDDTFDAPASQLYLYEAANGADVWNDKGTLYAFVSDTESINDYGDITEDMEPVDGHFIPVPRDIATGKLGGDLGARDVTSADFGYPTPPPGVPNGPQWVLEQWSNRNNAFQFIRIEDTAYNRNNPRIVYLADSGEPRAVADAGTTRLRRASSGTNGPYMNGRIWKLTLGSNPLQRATLDVLRGTNFDTANGGAPSYAYANTVHQPDNVETTGDALYIQEDPGSHNSSSPPRNAAGELLYPAFPDATNARVWRYDLTSGALTVVAEVNQSVPGAPTLPKASWESSGIVDASAIFGPGAFLVDVQAHSWDMDAGIGNDSPAVPKREHGQLLLLRAPGS